MQSEPGSPARLTLRTSLSQASLRIKSAYRNTRTHSRHVDAYDGEYKQALLNGEVGNGVRSWYSNYTSIGKFPCLEKY